MATNANVKFLSKVLPTDVNGKAGTVSCVLGNGLRVEVEVGGLSDEIRERLMYHGLSQKLGDSAAGFSKDRDFSGAFAAIQSTADNLIAGVWASRASSGISDLVAAIADIHGVSVEVAQAAVDKMTEDQVSAVRKHPAVKKAIADMQAARLAAAAENSASSLDDLMGDLGL